MNKKARESLKKIDQELNYQTLDDNGYGLKTPIDMGYNFCREEINTISQALDQANKLEETMKLIVEKGVNVGAFEDMLEDWANITFEDYLAYKIENGYEVQNDYDFDTNPLTEAAFNQIKEVIEKYGK